MKVLSDVSAIIKIALICVVVGFLLGMCATGAVHAQTEAGTAIAVR